MTPPPECTSLAQCRDHDGERVAVTGVYRTHDPYPTRKRDADLPLLARLELTDTEKGPLLEPFWHEDAARPAEERERLNGRRVRVLGVFHADPPRRPGADPDAASFGGPCIHPVESLEAMEEG